MIIPNGTIEVLSSENGGLDAQGFPRKPVTTGGEPILCQYSPLRYDATALRNGEPVTERQFSILIEEQPQEFAADRVSLKTTTGRTIGVFSVKSIEPLEAVGQVKITV